MKWSVETLNHIVDKELENLPADMRARFVKLSELIEAVGLEQLGAPHVRHLRDAIWEMRLSGRAGIARALYVAISGRRVVVLRAFVKKTQKTPQREIELAIERMKELKK